MSDRTELIQQVQVQAGMPVELQAGNPAEGVVALGTGEAAELVNRHGLGVDEIHGYLNPGEQLAGFGKGGSESLVMFVNSPKFGRIVRKVCAEDLSSVGWDPNGTGVMTPPSTKGGLQVDYLLGLPEPVKDYFPLVHGAHIRHTDNGGRKLVYDQSFLKGIEVSTFVAEAQPTPGVVTHLHHEVMRLLAERVHPHREILHTGDSIQVSHLDKIAARLELSRSAAPETFGPLIDAPTILINGKEYQNIGQLLAFFRQPQVLEMLEPKFHALVMGDTNTENVMITNPGALLEAMQEPGRPEFTYDDVGLKFLDPRAIGHNSQGGSTTDDRMYDNKPVHNTLGHYDVMHGEHFSIAVDSRGRTPHVSLTPKSGEENPYAIPYTGLADSGYFKEVMKGWNVEDIDFLRNDPNWLLRFTFMMGSHFAAMPPFHFERNEAGVVPEDVQLQKRAIAIYCQGIKWLNRAREMVEGTRTELYGVKLGALAASARE